MSGVTTAIGEILRRNQPAPRQVERYKVERWKQIGRHRWAWVEVGTFSAVSREDARGKGRNALADQICILRAEPVGMAPKSAAEAGVL